VSGVEHWHLPSIEQSGTREPRVLFSQPEFRAVVVDLKLRDELGDHRVQEHTVLQVVSGRVRLGLGSRELECEAGSLVRLQPRETRSVTALEPSRILLVLAPWPAEGHFPEGWEADPERIAPNAAEPPHD